MATLGTEVNGYCREVAVVQYYICFLWGFNIFIFLPVVAYKFKKNIIKMYQ